MQSSEPGRALVGSHWDRIGVGQEGEQGFRLMTPVSSRTEGLFSLARMGLRVGLLDLFKKPLFYR